MLAGILQRRFQMCRDKGFDAVEFDNLDSYGRSGGRLDIEDALAPEVVDDAARKLRRSKFMERSEPAAAAA